MEIWKDIPGYEGRYKVSDEGRVKRFFFGGNQRVCPKYREIIKPSKTLKGYLYVGLNNGNGQRKIYGVHRLVALAFIPNPENKPEPNHKDHNPSNNHVSNLEWVTESENVKHSWTNPIRQKFIAGRYVATVGYFKASKTAA